MSQYTCQHCEKQTASARSIPSYDQQGKEKRWEVLCKTCHDEWLQALKG